jgi:hypothetical protein
MYVLHIYSLTLHLAALPWVWSFDGPAPAFACKLALTRNLSFISIEQRLGRFVGAKRLKV